MSEFKTRYYITPSSLGSYFGVGFNSPEEQFKIDSGQTPTDFDQDSIERMALGSALEEGVTNYFQDIVFKTPITNRNEEIKLGYNNDIKYAIDGRMTLAGVPTGFECKISNSKSYKFTENKGYFIQVQTYMLCEDLTQFVLAGLYQGKPIYKIIQRDEEVIEDIKRMIDFVVNALQGLVDFYEEFPTDLLDKYSDEKIYEPINNLSKKTVDYLHALAELNAQKSEIEKAIKDLKRTHGEELELTEGVYEDDVVYVKASHWTKKGSFDIDDFMIHNPHFDLTPYYTPDTKMSRLVVKLK